jgi:hypothetical protein
MLQHSKLGAFDYFHFKHWYNYALILYYKLSSTFKLKPQIFYNY